jgi:hypothetical protein
VLDAESDGADRRAGSDLAVGEDLSGTYVTLDRISDVEGPAHVTFQKAPEPKSSKARRISIS